MTDEQINKAIAKACGFEADYCKDLNAMHEAEKALNRYQQSVIYYLMKMVGYHTFDSAHATARQRAEAFLKTLNLWKQ